jgi:23S rRNA pseudouridine2605 synthase
VNTSGLLLFTNDGELAHRLMHPSSEVEREYRVRLRGMPPPDVIDRLRRGVVLEDGPANFDRISTESSDGSHSWFRVELHEGRNREVRRLFEHEGFEVSKLSRMRYGTVKLPSDLCAGDSIRLDSRGIDELSRVVGGGERSLSGGPGKP